MTVFMNCNDSGDTWRQIIEASGWQRYGGTSRNGDVVIRWGANQQRHADTYVDGVRVLNKDLMLNKLDQLKRMMEAGVRVPRFWTGDIGYQAAGSPAQCVVKRATGTRGFGISLIPATRMYDSRGMMVLKDSRDRDLYYQEFIDKTHEYRVMAVGNTVAFYMEKTAPAYGSITWNLHQGAEWAPIEDAPRGLRGRLKDLSIAALSAIHYDFGAVDIICTEDDNFYVLEVNSKPEFGERNTEHFVNAINSYLSTNAGEETPAISSRNEERAYVETLERGARVQELRMTTRNQPAMGLSNWRFCPYCSTPFDEGRGQWRYCPHCQHELA